MKANVEPVNERADLIHKQVTQQQIHHDKNSIESNKGNNNLLVPPPTDSVTISSPRATAIYGKLVTADQLPANKSSDLVLAGGGEKERLQKQHTKDKPVCNSTLLPTVVGVTKTTADLDERYRSRLLLTDNNEVQENDSGVVDLNTNNNPTISNSRSMLSVDSACSSYANLDPSLIVTTLGQQQTQPHWTSVGGGGGLTNTNNSSSTTTTGFVRHNLQYHPTNTTNHQPHQHRPQPIDATTTPMCLDDCSSPRSPAAKRHVTAMEVGCNSSQPLPTTTITSRHHSVYQHTAAHPSTSFTATLNTASHFIPAQLQQQQQQQTTLIRMRPLMQMSLNLIRTYKNINEIYYRKKRRTRAAAAGDQPNNDATGGVANQKRFERKSPLTASGHQPALSSPIAGGDSRQPIDCSTSTSQLLMTSADQQLTSQATVLHLHHHHHHLNSNTHISRQHALQLQRTDHQQLEQAASSCICPAPATTISSSVAASSRTVVDSQGNGITEAPPPNQLHTNRQPIAPPLVSTTEPRKSPPPPTSTIVDQQQPSLLNNKSQQQPSNNTDVSSSSSSTLSTAVTSHHHHHHHHQHHQVIVRPGEVWNGRYRVISLIGRGSFGQVIRSLDQWTGEEVAIKVIKNKRSYMQQAQIEIEILKEIAAFQSNGRTATELGANHIVNLRDNFTVSGHLCLVFELLSYTLYQLLGNTDYRGVSLYLTRKFAQQLCAALLFLASRQPHPVIHCDLKPENILLVNPKRSAIKVIDFGSSCHVNQRVYQYIQSRFYRSPEVLFKLDYGLGIDMWSLGCILVEMHTGEPLFSGTNELEQLLQIIEVLGYPPTRMIESSPNLATYFDRVVIDDDQLIHSLPQSTSWPGVFYKPKLVWVKQDKWYQCQFNGPHSRPLRQVVGADIGGPYGRRAKEPGHGIDDYDMFVDLVQRMLVYEPKHRLRPDEALMHRFFVRKTHSSSKSSSSKPGSVVQSPSSSQKVTKPADNPPSYLTFAPNQQPPSVKPGVEPVNSEEPVKPGGDTGSMLMVITSSG